MVGIFKREIKNNLQYMLQDNKYSKTVYNIIYYVL